MANECIVESVIVYLSSDNETLSDSKLHFFHSCRSPDFGDVKDECWNSLCGIDPDDSLDQTLEGVQTRSGRAVARIFINNTRIPAHSSIKLNWGAAALSLSTSSIPADASHERKMFFPNNGSGSPRSVDGWLMPSSLYTARSSSRLLKSLSIMRHQSRRRDWGSHKEAIVDRDEFVGLSVQIQFHSLHVLDLLSVLFCQLSRCNYI